MYMCVYNIHVFPLYFGDPCSSSVRLRSEDLSLALGPGSSAWGRRPKRQLATVAMGDVAAESESDNSEPDLGHLLGRLRCGTSWRYRCRYMYNRV